MANLIGAGWMILAMGLYATVDSFVKLSTATLPQSQVLMAVGFVGLGFFVILARARGIKPLPLSVFRGTALLRTFFDAGASTAFIYALNSVDLSLFTTIVQANPLLVVLGAAVFLRQPVGWRRWMAIIVGLVGVLIVLRPTGATFTPAALLVVAGVIMQSGRDLTTSRVGKDIHSVQLSAAALLSMIAVGFVLGVAQDSPPVRPEGMEWAYLAGACGVFIPAVYAMIASMRVGDVGFVAPFRYTRIVFGLGLGVVVFGETLDGYMLLGAAIIVGSGLYMLWRETRLRHASKSSQAAL